MADRHAGIDEPRDQAVDAWVDAAEVGTQGGRPVIRQRVQLAGSSASDVAGVTQDGQLRVHDAGLGLDGADPPSIAGQGVRGWLRGIYEKLGGGATEDTLLDVKRALTDHETRLDYGARTDGNPVYVGKAPQGAPAADPVWTVQRLDYDSSARLVRAQVLSGVSWDGRAAASWS